MTVNRFPPVEFADKQGVLAVGGDVEPASLLLAYKSGIFPWPIDDMLVWFAPPKRAVLFVDKFHPSRSLEKEIKQGKFQFAIDKKFDNVVRACASATNRNGPGTWINSEMIEGYTALHKKGYAHSVECYQKGKLVGGLYGVSIGSMFAGESMFYVVPNASKMCLYYLVKHLAEKGGEWIDCQVMTPHLKRFGAEELRRSQFMKILKKAVRRKVKLF